MPVKQLVFGDAAHERMLKGVDQPACAVRVTLGPRGRTVLLERDHGGLQVVNSGVVVARSVELEDPFENLGAQMLREVASRTSEMAGDGTTTATVLAHSMLSEGMKYLAAGMNPMDLKRGIEQAVEAVVAEIRQLARPCTRSEEIAHVAAISANNDRPIGLLIAQAMDKVGRDGAITIEDGSGISNELETVVGLQFDRGWLSPYFVTQVNNMRAVLKCCAVKAPGFGERRKAMLQDIATVVGGSVVSDELGQALTKVKLWDLGRARRVEVDQERTTLIGGAGSLDAIEARVAALKRERDAASSDCEREKLDERLAKLVGGVAVIKVGAATEVELRERKLRVEDALHATRAAVDEGLVPGGGVALLRCRRALNALAEAPSLDHASGVNIVRRALDEPSRCIATNAADEPSIVLSRVDGASEVAYGYNAAARQYGDLVQMGVIYPAKVTRMALQNAASVAGLLLTTDCVIANRPVRLAPHALSSAMSPDLGDVL